MKLCFNKSLKFICINAINFKQKSHLIQRRVPQQSKMEKFGKLAKKASSLAVRSAPGIMKAGAKVLPLLSPATSVAVIIAPVLEAVAEATGALMDDISQKIMEDSASEDTLGAVMKQVKDLELSDNDN